MKKLTQEVFSGQPDWVKSAAVDADGDAYLYSIKKEELEIVRGFWGYLHKPFADCEYIGQNYDATDWQNSAIDREAQ